jgi:hypothetical protein
MRRPLRPERARLRITEGEAGVEASMRNTPSNTDCTSPSHLEARMRIIRRQLGLPPPEKRPGARFLQVRQLVAVVVPER